MQIDDPSTNLITTDFELIRQHLPITGGQILELGCGRAAMTRKIATELAPQSLVATEVDEIQHQKNLEIDDLPNTRFLLAGAESIPLDDASVDVVIMLKSLHHVPVELMGQALGEVARVLKPGGLAYLSEPIYRGAFNDIMRLFHDEKEVRQHAFAAIRESVENGLLQLRQQIFFNSPSHYQNFAEFDRRMLQVTHTRHRIDSPLRQRIQEAFSRHMTATGADFLNPMRVDLLQRP